MTDRPLTHSDLHAAMHRLRSVYVNEGSEASARLAREIANAFPLPAPGPTKPACQHPRAAIRYIPDPSGNSDTAYTCDACGKHDLSSEERKRYRDGHDLCAVPAPLPPSSPSPPSSPPATTPAADPDGEPVPREGPPIPPNDSACSGEPMWSKGLVIGFDLAWRVYVAALRAKLERVRHKLSQAEMEHEAARGDVKMLQARLARVQEVARGK